MDRREVLEERVGLREECLTLAKNVVTSYRHKHTLPALSRSEQSLSEVL